MTLREDADFIISEAIHKVLPDEAVAKALKDKGFGAGKLYVVSAGKAAWQMAKTAGEILGDKIEKGVVVTKYDHVYAQIPNMDCYEGGAPRS